MINIVFYYPSKKVGGAQYLFYRLAQYLASKENYRVYYVDYSDGFIARKLKGSNISLLVCNLGFFSSTRIPSNSIVITPLSSIFEILWKVSGEFKVLFWSIHPVGLADAILGLLRFNFRKVKLDAFGDSIDYMMSKKAVFFMDGSNLDYQKEIFQFTNKVDEFLPICTVEKKVDYSLLKTNEKSLINIGWLGRLCIEKVTPLINVLEHLSIYALNNTNLTFIVHVIGDGDKKFMLDNISLPSNIKLCFVGVIVDSYLDEYISQKVDLVFAMGTSTLDCASMKKPVVLVDFSYEKIPLTNKFRWLFESERFSVGDLFTEKEIYNHEFSEIMEVMNNSELKENIANECYKYFIKNHTVSSVGDNLLSKIQCVLLTKKDLRITIFHRYRVQFFLKRFKDIIFKIIR